ncbi:YifB family Mg chelatase-like AAA ATPase [Maledivibacter halophilus]|uniref:Magnesium chelatase family protein n=1 Tax=Maledivibacter halophilus TaxID=36842 RepID=A0A1T5K1K8_9FIRM|nr:YifB family Mg chelatase-like AAA ATPase [Maledivibacter halophilus]SKC57359.1 magnesium chelatase family protein [Maledivibacter halophilus]
MASIINSFAISGIEGYLVEIETDTIYGQPSISIIGLGDRAIKEASERIQAAIIHEGYEFPKMKIVINLAPGDIKKKGSHFDLGMAVGLLLQSKQFAHKDMDLDSFGFIGELSLNGIIRPCTGILPMVIAAKKAGIKNIILPSENAQEACLVSGINIYTFKDLKSTINFLKGNNHTKPIEKSLGLSENANHILDFEDVKGQDALIEYIVVAAAGGHNMLMVGTPGCGKSMIAKRIPTVLPKMSEEEALEVTKIYSVSGLLKDRNNLITQRPFRAPHHNSSLNSLVGGGNNAMPGEVSLAHNGVLFLDEVAEFSKKTLDALRQPMEDKKVTISRVNSTNIYPSNFMFIAAMNPCPCGYYSTNKCKCSDYEVIKYRQKISGPILDRIDIQKYVQPVNFIELTENKKGISSKDLRERVEKARKIQIRRYKNIKGINCNGQMTPDLIKKYCKLEDDSNKLLKIAYDKYGYSARTFDKFLKVARTFADLEGSIKIRKKDIANVLLSRDLDKEKTRMYTV